MSRYLKFALILAFVVITYAFHTSSHIRLNSRKLQICRSMVFMTKGDENHDPAIEEIRNKLRNSEYYEAYQILKRNPIAHLSFEDGKQFLNNIDALAPITDDFEKRQKQLVDASSFIYKRLERQNVIRGFGCLDGEYPEKTLDITPSKLEELSGLKIESLTPKARNTYWQLAAISLAFAEYLAADSLGLNPLLTVIPATLFFVFGDQVVLKGAISESVYQFFNPEYRKKVICHEAGHFLLAYLSGVPIQGCVTNAWDARKYPELRGPAGTIYYDGKFVDELSSSRVTRTSLDRLSVITMAGIAAEALKYSKAEGGVADERALIQLLTSISPPWNILRIQSQARWSALQAILIIREHQASFDSLVKALEEKKGLGDIIEAIEKNLPEALPSQQRIEIRKQKMKESEVDVLMRYVQRMTWRVGGIEAAAEDVIHGEQPYASEDGLIHSKGSFTDESNAAASSSNASASSESAVQLFTERIRQLETAVKDGALDVPERSGGIWLNSLDSYEKPSASIDPSLPKVEPEIKVLEGFEQRIAELQAKGELAIEEEDSGSINAMLSKHRGYQIKQLENMKIELRKRNLKVNMRLTALAEAPAKVLAMKK